MAIFEVVRFNGLKSKDWLIYKMPSQGIIWGSQVIVQEGQVAIFVKGGQVYDVMYPGTYTLETKNLPILSKIVNIPFGGETPFSAEIYFVNTTTRLDIHWGTTDPIQLIDPKYFVKLRVRAFGQMGLKISDYTLFFKELVGGMNQAEIVKFDKIEEYYRGLIVLKVKSIIADTILGDKISALEVATQLEKISNETREKIEEEFKKYGFNVINFYIQSINFPDEDFEKINEILEDKAQFEIMGDARYSTKRSFDIYETAAGNEGGVAGALAAGGLGLGVGMNMAGNMNNTVETPTSNHNLQVYCPNCHASVDEGSKFCPACGAVMKKPEPEVKNCPNCGKLVPSETKFCPECGANLQQKVCDCGHVLPLGAKFCTECGKPVE